METIAIEAEGWITDKSVQNMLSYFRSDLMRLMRGGFKASRIPSGTRKRFVEHGILRKFGSKFELTERGRLLLTDS